MQLSTDPTAERDVTSARALIAPGSIAVIGASERSRWSASLLDNLDRHGFDGRIDLVNPRGGKIKGRSVTRTCADLDGPIDLGVLFVPASAVVKGVEDLAAAGARAAMILTSGFAEVGEHGRMLQGQLVESAEAAGVRLLGPNSLGFMNFVEGTVGWATPIGAPRSTEGVALVSQSGATALFLADLALRQDVPLSYVVSTGNEADLDCSTFARGLATAPGVKAIAMFVESVRHPARFIAAAEAVREAGKPMVVLKVGASEITARSALAHTGALVGDDRVFDAICARYGVIRVHSLEDLVTTADIVGRTEVLPPGGLLVVSNSGGICEVAADTASALGIELPDVPPSVVADVTTAMPAFATPHNPLDLTGGIDPAQSERILEVLLGTGRFAAALVPYYPVASDDSPADQRLTDLHRHLSRGLRSTDRAGFLVSYTSSTIDDTGRRTVGDLQLPYLACGMDRALVGLGHAFRWSAHVRTEDRSAPTALTGPPIPDRPVSELSVLDLLGRQGVPVVPHVLVTSEHEAVMAARRWKCPVVLKVASPDIAHKTEIGGVALNVSGDREVADAFRRTMRVGEAQPGAVIEGVLVCPMRQGGVELIVGCSNDPVWGPMIAVGLGGIWVEVLADVALSPLPVRASDVRDMLSRLRAHALLRGPRGLPVADLDAVGTAVAAIGDVAQRLGPDLTALEVNPLWVRGSAVEALDALAVWERPGLRPIRDVPQEPERSSGAASVPLTCSARDRPLTRRE